MKYEYDSWNRIQRMTYPDGEVVSYGYNKGGMLKSVSGGKNGVAYRYIDSIHYTEFELKDTVWYGNGARATYDYDVLLRLSHLRSLCADGTMQDIDYSYDEVGNIGDIVNHAGMLANGLGGTYRSSCAYDNLYRLAYAAGYWHGNNSLYYETSLDYERNGRISKKDLYADTWMNGNYVTENYHNEYHYENSGQPNTLSYINDNPNQYFEWDLKGNMIFHHNEQSGHDRSLCWDEQNRLQGVKDNRYLSYYQYDANGDRTYKLTGKGELQNISGNWQYYYLLDNATLYASPYLVATDRGYTKHYYAESERIASRIGGGLGDALGSGLMDEESFSAHQAASAEHFDAVVHCLGADAQPVDDLLLFLYDWRDSVQPEKECYWYHPDHLGSSSWITYSDGKAVQHLHYLPWGEDFVDQRLNGYEGARYTFSAKERDPETGLSYFGSRYYSSDLSIWLSVDPMSAKYPSLSPYTYCADNPVKLTDPDGRWIPGLDEDYNITVTKEEGDDFNSFKEFMGPGYSDEEIQNMFENLNGDKINLTKSYGGVFRLMTNALVNANYDPEFMDDANYNCWGAALSLTSGYELFKRSSYTSGSGINTEEEFDELLTKLYSQITPEMASVGKTVLRYGFTPDVAKHAAIYMGRDRSGNEYVFTKNGWGAPPVISTEERMLAPGGYGVNCSIGSENDNNCYGNGYYNRKTTSKQHKR